MKRKMSEWYRKEVAAHKRALNGPQKMRNGMEPFWKKPAMYYGGNRNELGLEKLVLYAAALGQMRGLLPADLGRWEGAVVNYDGGDDAQVHFAKGHAAKASVVIELHNLKAWPEPAVEELSYHGTG